MRRGVAACFLLAASCARFELCLADDPVHVAGQPVAFWSGVEVPWPYHHMNPRHVGAVRIDAVRGTAELAPDLRVSTWFERYFDWRSFTYTLGEPAGDRLVVRDERGEIAFLGWPEHALLSGLHVFAEGGEWWAFYIVNPPYGAAEPPTLVRVRLRDASMARVPVPAGTGFLVPGDGRVSAQSPDVAYVCDHERTWRIDFRTGEWSDPIAGRFRVVDRSGTLVEWFGGTMIVRGERQACPFADGRAVIFDTGRGVCRDESGAFVLRSLRGEPDIPLPCPPPLYEGPLPAH